MRRLAPFALAALLLSQAPFGWPWDGLLVFPALGLLGRWSDANPGEHP